MNPRTIDCLVWGMQRFHELREVVEVQVLQNDFILVAIGEVTKELAIEVVAAHRQYLN